MVCVNCRFFERMGDEPDLDKGACRRKFALGHKRDLVQTLNIRYRPVEVTKEELLLRILNEMRDWHIEEVLLIDTDGNLTHLKGKGVSRLP